MLRAKKWQVTLWLLGCAIPFLILVVGTLGPRFQNKVEEAWSWFLPNVMPSLSLITAALVAEALSVKKKTESVDGFVFRTTLLLSGLYIGLVTVTIVNPPFTQKETLELMKTSNLFLGPLQGLVAATRAAVSWCGWLTPRAKRGHYTP